MIQNIKSLTAICSLLLIVFIGCKKPEYSFGDIKSPTGLTITTVVVGTDVANPNGNGTGNVTITANSSNALTYKIDFGDGSTPQVVPSGIITYKYKTPGIAEYTININAIGTGGATSTISKKVKVFVAFEIPAAILANLTGGTSKIWITDKAEQGHFGVGQTDLFFPNYYGAGPNSREACAYDDEITFSKDVNNNVFINVNNKGESFSIGDATAFYGFGGGDGCYAINTGGLKKLAFSDASSSSTPSNSTRIQFSVPGNGIVNFGTGGKDYEIIALTDTQVTLRSIGVGNNLAWYIKLKVK